MDERLPDEPTSRAPAHPAPTETWRPLSGLAVTAFVLSLVGILIAMAGLWWVQAGAVVLAFAALASLRSGAKRGRGFAVAALAIAAPTAFIAYDGHAGMRQNLRSVANGVLSSLKMDDEKALEVWLDRAAAEGGAAARLRERYRAVVAEAGAYEGEVEVGSLWAGALSAFVPPMAAKELAVATTPGKGPEFAPATVWGRARFARGTLWVGLVLRSGEQKEIASLGSDLKGVISDVRFFQPTGSAPATR